MQRFALWFGYLRMSLLYRYLNDFASGLINTYAVVIQCTINIIMYYNGLSIHQARLVLTCSFSVDAMAKNEYSYRLIGFTKAPA